MVARLVAGDGVGAEPGGPGEEGSSLAATEARFTDFSLTSLPFRSEMEPRLPWAGAVTGAVRGSDIRAGALRPGGCGGDCGSGGCGASPDDGPWSSTAFESAGKLARLGEDTTGYPLVSQAAAARSSGAGAASTLGTGDNASLELPASSGRSLSVLDLSLPRAAVRASASA